MSGQEALGKLKRATELGLVSTMRRFEGDALALGVKGDARLITLCHCCPCCCVSTGIHLASHELRDVSVDCASSPFCADPHPLLE